MAKRILLADDSVTAQNMGRKILSDAGYDVVTVNNGSAALKKIAEQKPEIIILDVYMPGYSGLEVCQRLKEAPETSPIPVLLTVGKLEPFKAEEAKRVHADAFIIKPFEATELLTVLAKLEDKIAPQPAPKASQAKASQARAAQEKPEKEKAQGRQPGRGGSINDRAVPTVPTPPVTVRNPPKTKESSEAEAEWKNRLRIPGPPATAFHDLRIPRAAASPGAAEPEAFEIALPPGITSEEIAAISEAASLISAEAPETEAEAESGESEVAASTGPAEFPTTFAAVPAEPEPALEAPVAAASVEFAAPPAEEYHPEPTAAEAIAEESATEAFIPEAAEVREAEVESHAGSGAPAASEPAPVHDDHDDHLAEIEVALASLAPVENVQFEGVVSAEAHRAAFASQGVEVYPRGHGSLVEELYGARWIAEEVPVDEATCALSLDREMQQVYEMSRANGHAATAVAEAEIEAASSMGAFQAIEESVAAAGAEAFVPQEAYSFESESEAAAVVAVGPSDEEAAAVAASGFVGDADSSQHEDFAVEVAANEPAEAGLAEVEPANLKTASEPELSVQPESEPEQVVEDQASQQPDAERHVEPAVEAVASAEVPVPEDVSVAAVAVSEQEPSAHHESVEAPAASTDLNTSYEVESSPQDVSYEAATTQAETSDTRTSDSSTIHDFPSARGDDDEQPPDVAAAWARWRQIRDSLTSPEFTEQLADAAAGEVLAAQAHHDNGAGGDLGAHFKDIRQNELAPPQAEPAPQAAAAAAAGGAADSAAISSIVESVLAELKPKLVEEIAKKLGKR